MDLALFDFDGTLTERETLPDFVRFAVPGVRLQFGRVALAPLILGYRAGWVSGVGIRAALAAVGFSGVSVERYRAKGAAFAREVLPGVLMPHAMQRLQWHRQRGDRLVLVSGGWDVYLKPWCESQGVELLCSALQVRGARLSGRFDGEQCVGPEKANRVRQLLQLDAFEKIHAYGDTAEDEALLALAHVATYRWQQR